MIPRVCIRAAGIEEKYVVQPPVVLASLKGIRVGRTAFPDDFVLKILVAENLIEHHLDVVARVPVTVIVEAAGRFQDTCDLHATRPHVLDVGLSGSVAILKRPLLLRLAPEHLIIAIRIERRIDISQIVAAIRKLAKLLQTVSAVNDPCIDEGRRA